MRDSLISTGASHVGLAYERYAPVDSTTGKIPDPARNPWLEGLTKIPAPVGYSAVLGRWRSSLESDPRSRTVAITLASRLLIGHGNPAPSEVGLTVHHTWGTPVIPGSALKGLLAHYVDAVYGPEQLDVGHPMDPGLPEAARERARYRGVTWIGNRVQHGPGEVYRALFGAPPADDDADFPGAGETRGEVVFHDALWIPALEEKALPFAVDVLTVHHPTYYRARGVNRGPNDYDAPNPVSFLTVCPGSRFLVALTGNPEWTELAMTLLLDALVEWGVGGKTSAGYGRIEADDRIDPAEGEAIEPEVIEPVPSAVIERATIEASEQDRPVLDEFRDWLVAAETTKLVQRDRLARIQGEWLSRLSLLSPTARNEAAELIRVQLNSPRIRQLRQDLIAKLTS